jgi:hypothetical protein
MTEVTHDNTSSTRIVPPPWKLRGDGVILLYRLSNAFVESTETLPAERGTFRGGIGAVMLVDYAESGVGPYRELLFVPGRIGIGSIRAHTISKIYVSTQPSINSGRANWGIPKEHADFQRTQPDEVQQTWQVSTGEQAIFRITYVPGMIAFRVFTFPLFLPLVQHLDGQTFVTRLRASGICKLATVRELAIDPACFPDVSGIEPLGVLRVSTFSMTFPVPRRVK